MHKVSHMARQFIRFTLPSLTMKRHKCSFNARLYSFVRYSVVLRKRRKENERREEYFRQKIHVKVLYLHSQLHFCITFSQFRSLTLQSCYIIILVDRTKKKDRKSCGHVCPGYECNHWLRAPTSVVMDDFLMNVRAEKQFPAAHIH